MKRKIFLSLLLGGGCLYLSLRNIDGRELRDSFRGLLWWPALLIPPMNFLTHLFRARRLRVLLRPVRSIPLRELFGINAVGFLAINVLPFRLGELTRPLLFKRRHGIPLSTGLAAIGVERVFDGLITGLALVIGLLGAPASFGESSLLGIRIRSMAYLTLALYIPVLGFLWFAVWRRDLALRAIQFSVALLPTGARLRIEGIVMHFFEGLRALPNLWGIGRLFLESVGVWSVMIVAQWMALLMFRLDLSWTAPFNVLGIGAVGVTLPNPPGFIGTYQLFVQAALLPYGVAKSVSFAYGSVLLLFNLGYSITVGSIYVPKMAARMGKLIAEEEELASAARP